MKRFFSLAAILLAITACQKEDSRSNPDSTPSITAYKTIDNGFWPGGTSAKTDPSNGNVWIFMHRQTGKRHQVPYAQCFDSNMNSLSGGWVALTDADCLGTISGRGFTILNNGNALFVYCDTRENGEDEIPYFTIVTPEGKLLKPEGTLVYNTIEECYGSPIETAAISDGKGGAWVAIAQKVLVVRHISPSGEMSEPVKLKVQKSGEQYHGLELMPAQDGGLFLTFLDLTKIPRASTADFTGHTTLLKISADCKLEFEKQLNPEENCDVGTVPRMWPDAKGGAYLTRKGVEPRTKNDVLYYSHFDRNGNIDAAFEENYKIGISTRRYNGCTCAVVPGSNALCIVLCEFTVSDDMKIIGYSSSLTSVDENGETIFKDLKFKEFDSTANPTDFVMTARNNDIVDIFYLFCDNRAANYNATLGCLNVSDLSVTPTISSITSPLTQYDTFWLAENENAYVNGKMNLVICAKDFIAATQITK